MIVHWRIHNYLRSDRYKTTVYTAEKALLSVKENGEYASDSTLGIPLCIPSGNQRSTQYSIDKNSIGNRRNASKRTRFTPPTPKQVNDYCAEKGYPIDADRFVDFYTSKGWKVGNTPMKDWKAAARNWNRINRTAAPEQPNASPVFVD